MIEQGLHRLQQGRGAQGRHPQQHRLLELRVLAAVLEQVADDRRGRQGADRRHRRQARLGVQFGRDRRQRAHALVLEHLARAQLEPGLARAPDQLDRTDAVAAEGEEAVVDADRGQAQHLGEQAAQQPFALADRRRAGIDLDARRRQRLAVELAVRGQRQGRHRDERRRQHVLGQPLREFAPQLRRVDLRRRHVSDQLAMAGPVLARDHRIGAVAERGQRGLDFARFDAEAADLELVVGAAEVFEQAVAAPARQVAGAVHALAGRERIGEEAFGAERGPAEVAAGQAGTADVQLAGHAGRHRLQARVEHVQPGVAQRAADAGAFAGLDLIDRDIARIDRAFGRAVAVVAAYRVLAQGAPLRFADRLAAEHDRAGVAAARVEQALGAQLLEMRRGQVDRIDAPLGDVVDQRLAFAAGVVVDQVQFLAGAQPQQAFQRGVEGEGRGQGEAHALAAVVAQHLREQAFAMFLEQVGHAGVGHDHALGFAGRAGGMDHIGRMQRMPGRAALAVAGAVLAGAGEFAGVVVEQQARRGIQREHRRAGAVADRQARRGLGEQFAQPSAGVAGVDRQVGRAGLERAEHRRDRIDRARQRQRDPVLGADAARDQRMGDAVGAPVEFAIAQGLVAADDRAGLRGGRDLTFEPLRQRGPGGVDPGAARVREHPLAFVGVEQADLTDPRLRIGGDRAQHPLQAAADALRGAGVEQVVGVLDHPVQARRRAALVAQLGEVEAQVELGDVEVEIGVARAQSRQGQFGLGVVLQRQHHLEQRRVRHRARRLERVDQALERQVLVLVGGEVGLAHPAEQFGEARIARGVVAQHQGVEEHPDQIVERGVAAAGDRRAQGDVVAAAEPVQGRRQRGLQDHEQGRAVTLRQRAQLRVQGRVQAQRQMAAAVARAGRARPVGRQRDQFGQPGQRVLPVVQLARQRAVGVGGVAEGPALPQGVVGVLHRQRGPGRRAPAQARGVGVGEIARQRRQRGAVAGDVMQQQQQGVAVGREREQVRAQRDLALQVEGVARGLRQLGTQVVVAGPAAAQFDRGPVEHLLARLGAGREHRAQAFVAGQQVVQRGLQRVGVEFAVQVQGQRDVVGRAGALELMQEPQPLLGERQRQLRRPRLRRERRAAAGAGRQHPRQRFHAGVVEQAADRQFDPEGRADPADQPGREQGMAAEREEAVLDADLGGSALALSLVGTRLADAEHLGEQRAQDRLGGVARRARARRSQELRRRQRAPVELAGVGGQRQRGQGDERGRDHVLGQAPRQLGAQRVGIDRFGDHVGDQQLSLRLVLAHDHRIGRIAALGQRGFDLAQLDAEAAQLDLLVGAAEVVELAVLAPARQVAGAVHALAAAERVGEEAFGAQRRPAEIAAGQAGAADVQLAGDPGGDRTQHRVEHVQPGVGDRRAERRRLAVERLRAEVAAHRRADGDLGRAVGVEHMPSGRPGLGQVRRAGFAADDQGRGPGRARRVEAAERARRDQGVADALAFEHPRQRVAEQQARRRQHQPRAGGEAHQHFHGRRVEAHRGELQHPAVGVQAEALDLAVSEAGNAGVGDHHALGPAGRAGGVDHIGRVLRRQRAHPFAVVGVVARRVRDLVGEFALAVEQQQLGGVGGRQARGGGGGRQHAARARVGEGVAEPVERMVRVQRQIGRAGLEHAEQGDHGQRRARDRQADPVLRADPARDQRMRHAVGAAVEFGVAEHDLAGDQRDRLGRPRHAALEPLRHGLRRQLDFVAAPVVQHAPALAVVEQVEMLQRALRMRGHRVEQAR